MENKRVTKLNGFDRDTYLFHSSSIEPIKEMISPLKELSMLHFRSSGALSITRFQLNENGCTISLFHKSVRRNHYEYRHSQSNNIYDTIKETFTPSKEDSYVFCLGLTKERAIRLGELLDANWVVF